VEFERKLERSQVENLLIGICYAGLRAVFLSYQWNTNYYLDTEDRITVVHIGNMYPFVNDMITLTPPIFLLIFSSQLRQLITQGPKKNRVHFEENANKIEVVEEHLPPVQVPIPAKLEEGNQRVTEEESEEKIINEEQQQNTQELIPPDPKETDPQEDAVDSHSIHEEKETKKGETFSDNGTEEMNEPQPSTSGTHPSHPNAETKEN
jgi:hypothetical protein